MVVCLGRPHHYFLRGCLGSCHAGLDGGFDTKDPEYEETYSIVILPDFITLPFPNVELPEKVSWHHVIR